MKTDISTTCNQVQLLSKNHGDIISMVTAKLKQELAKKESLLLQKITQLTMQCDQLSQEKENSEAENKGLVHAMQEMQSRCRQFEEANKVTTSELRGELNGIKFLFFSCLVCV